ncbi:MAG: diguanylate cyclase [Anaerolineales bacterium]|nr:diguanylate cyclase [Anaerolineales bacterium]
MDQIPSELQAALEGLAGDRARVDRINQLAWDDRLDDPVRARRLSELAHQLATTGDFALESYGFGVACSLRTRAFLNNDVGNYTEALTDSLRVLELLEGLAGGMADTRPVMVDVLGTMSWTYRGFSDFAAAGEYGMKALRLAETLGDRLRQARLLNILGNIFAESNDLDAALHMGERALQLFREMGMANGESVALNNLSLTYLQRGDGPRALAACHESLRIAHDKGVSAVTLTALSTLGEIYLGLRDFEQADRELHRALALARERGARYDEFLNLLNLGKVHLGRGDESNALSTFKEALAIAEDLNDRAGQFQCHQLLAEVHESRGTPAAALAHYKRFHTLKETVFNENASKRLAGLQVIHQVETARRDAEIHYLRTIELRNEIEERKSAQAALEKLASLDPLTGLLNRRELHVLAEYAVAQARLTGKPLTAIVFDLDNFKSVNDTFGHATGDAALTETARFVAQNLREGELVGRYGGDEFVILLPGSGLPEGRQVAERLRTSLSHHVIATPQGDLRLTLSLGVAELDSAKGVGDLHVLLAQADQALYAAKQAGRNRVAVL